MERAGDKSIGVGYGEWKCEKDESIDCLSMREWRGVRSVDCLVVCLYYVDA